MLRLIKANWWLLWTYNMVIFKHSSDCFLPLIRLFLGGRSLLYFGGHHRSDLQLVFVVDAIAKLTLIDVLQANIQNCFSQLTVGVKDLLKYEVISSNWNAQYLVFSTLQIVSEDELHFLWRLHICAEENHFKWSPRKYDVMHYQKICHYHLTEINRRMYCIRLNMRLNVYWSALYTLSLFINSLTGYWTWYSYCS